MANHDVIVIGAGLNGLVAANYLAKAGKRVIPDTPLASTTQSCL